MLSSRATPRAKAKPTRDTTGFGTGIGASGTGSGKTKKSRPDEYAREVEQITKRTAALQAETAAMAGLNPLINDYGYAVEFARAKQDLLTAAQEAGVKITPELTKSIEGLAAGYANAVVASEQLAEKQDEIRQRAEEAMATAKDVTRGLVDGFIEGADKADILADSLKKIGNALIDDVLNSIFKVNNAAGGGGFLSSIFGGLFGGGSKSYFRRRRCQCTRLGRLQQNPAWRSSVKRALSWFASAAASRSSRTTGLPRH